MAKVTINDEKFYYDPSRKPMTEALAIEAGLKMRYTDWETEVSAGSMRALCGFIWLIWHRDGRDVTIEDILSGKVEVNLNGLLIEPDEGDADPTSPPPEPSATTGTSTSGSSRKSSE